MSEPIPENVCPKCGFQGVTISDRPHFIMHPPKPGGSPFGTPESVPVHIPGGIDCLRRQNAALRAKLAEVELARDIFDSAAQKALARAEKAEAACAAQLDELAELRSQVQELDMIIRRAYGRHCTAGGVDMPLDRIPGIELAIADDLRQAIAVLERDACGPERDPASEG